MEKTENGDTELEETLVSRQVLYTGKSYQFWLDEMKLPTGERKVREHLHHPGGVAILAIDENGRVPMVRQYRHPIGRVTLEIPAGKLDKIPNETLEHAASRELREETGFTAEKFISMGSVFPSAGIVDEELHLFLATGLKISEQELDDDEFIHVVWIPFEELKRKVIEGEISDAKVICAMAKAEKYTGKE